MNNKCQKLILNGSIIILTIFALFGVVFVVGLIHEGIHIVTGKGAESICWDFNLKMGDGVQNGYLLFHTVFDVGAYENVEEFNTWREYHEKWLWIMQFIVYIFLGVLIGILSSILVWHRLYK